MLQEALELLLLEEKIKKQMPKIYECMEKQAAGQEQSEEVIRLSICGQGFGFTRVAGYMIFWKKEGANILKGTQKESHTYGELIDGLIDLGEPSGESVEEWYKEVTGKDLYQKKEEKETEVAPAQENEEQKEPQSIENSIPEEDSQIEENTDRCMLCEEGTVIVSNNGEFTLKINTKGIARIEQGQNFGIFEFKYCPECGKEF